MTVCTRYKLKKWMNLNKIVKLYVLEFSVQFITKTWHKKCTLLTLAHLVYSDGMVNYYLYNIYTTGPTNDHPALSLTVGAGMGSAKSVHSLKHSTWAVLMYWAESSLQIDVHLGSFSMFDACGQFMSKPLEFRDLWGLPIEWESEWLSW